MGWKIKKGDKVIIRTGKHKGETGEIIKVLPKEARVVVKGLNLKARHVKPSLKHPEGGIIRQEMPIHVSNVAYLDPETQMPTRIGFRFTEAGVKVRYAKRSNTEIAGVK